MSRTPLTTWHWKKIKNDIDVKNLSGLPSMDYAKPVYGSRNTVEMLNFDSMPQIDRFCLLLDPWSLHHSRSQKKLYFFNRKTRASVFESPGQDSVADYQWVNFFRGDLTDNNRGAFSKIQPRPQSANSTGAVIRSFTVYGVMNRISPSLPPNFNWTVQKAWFS